MSFSRANASNCSCDGTTLMIRQPSGVGPARCTCQPSGSLPSWNSLAVSWSYTCWFPPGMSTMTATAIVSPLSRSRYGVACRSGVCVASAPPGRDERGVLVGAVFPGEVPSVDDVELAVRQPLMEELGVDRRHRTVPAAGDDLHRGLHLRQQIAQGRELGRVGAHVPHRLDEAVALVGRQIILTDR